MVAKYPVFYHRAELSQRTSITGDKKERRIFGEEILLNQFVLGVSQAVPTNERRKFKHVRLL